MAVHIALHETGATFDIKSLSFHKREHRQPPFLAINPAGKVPTLLVDGTPITEVAGCLLYLAKRFPEASLLPADPLAEAQAVSWMSFIASTLHPARRQGEDHVAEVWTLAERKLGDRDWVLGRYSIADIICFDCIGAWSMGPGRGRKDWRGSIRSTRAWWRAPRCSAQ